MGSLSGFLAQNKIKKENEFYAASNSFLDGKGEPLRWELRALTSKEDSVLRASCYTQVPIPGKRNQFMKELKSEEYTAKMVANCVVYPDLRDAALQDSYGVKTEIDLLQRMLNPGEYTDLLLKVQDLNGFEQEAMDKLVDEAKN